MSADHTAVVTGGASGIGREICRAFGEVGVNVVVADVREEPYEDVPSVADLFESLDGEVVHVQTDVTDEETVDSMFESAVQRFGHVDILVNNAGIARFGSVTETSTEDWHAELAVNLTGVFYCCKHGVPLLTRNEHSAIVNISSLYGIRGGVGNFGYSVTKGGVAAATKQLAADFAADGLRTNAVVPGFIDTRMFHEDTPDGTEQYAVRHTPQNRLGDPVEVARVVRFLASDNASFVNGQILPVDGGFTVI
ncbi:SDR family NAD(P)-dependent oxidoreductase [Halomarina halobia]|uniref:SDR family NAD(P)-dependent oxidoreductase n=1 Tax=Halomarina halobia TaxID=3033386 RepID=A0ABD6AF77_9EURY|nr:SDR family NAD(P)-dependent oxidoreductase [Halomarina sp. PSR21]